MAKLLIILSFIFLIPVQAESRFNEKHFIELLGEKQFRELDQRSRNWFDGKGYISVYRESFRCQRKFISDSIDIMLEDTSDFLNDEKEDWVESKKYLLALFPDFLKKKDLKVKRLIMAQYIKDFFDLEKDLKKWPDLLTNIPKFKERLASKTQHPAFTLLTEGQNEDGSYGNQNKIYCTSIAVLTFLSQGITTTSGLYGDNLKKAIAYLQTRKTKLNDNERQIILWCFAELYEMTGIASAEEAMLKIFPDFYKRVHWEIDQKQELFFLQTLVLKSCYNAGAGTHSWLEFKAKLDSFKDNKSPANLAARAIWGLEIKPELIKGFNETELKNKTSFVKRIMGDHIRSYSSHSKRAFKTLRQSFKEGELKINVNPKDFDKSEIKFLETVLPVFTHGYIYLKYLPGSKLIKQNKTKNKLDLDLVK